MDEIDGAEMEVEERVEAVHGMAVNNASYGSKTVVDGLGSSKAAKKSRAPLDVVNLRVSHQSLEDRIERRSR